MMPDSDGYPTDEEIEIIEKWDITKDGVRGLIAHIKSIWWMPDWGFRFRVGWLFLHTGGWSGNETPIRALTECGNGLFWMMTLQQTHVAGHYWFRIKKDVI